MKCLLVFLALFWGATFDLFSQKLKWGKIPEEDLKMTVYPLDSLASALVLDELGELTFHLTESEYRYRLDVHVRIKVLDKAGFDEGDIKIPFYSKDGYERMGDLDLQVFSPKGEKVKVSDKDIFEEKMDDDFSQVRFAVPGLQVGSVFEYQYSLFSKNVGSPRTWTFQQDIPVRRSEFNVRVPTAFRYGYLIRGNRFIQREEDAVRQEYVGARYTADVTNTHYIAEKLPALKSEPYMTTLKNHAASIQMQLDRISWPNSPEDVFMPTWVTVAEKLWEDSNFGLQIKKEKHHSLAWAALQPQLAPLKDPLEKLEKTYEFLNSKMKWNEEFSIYADKTLNDAFEKGTGNSADLNLTLVACLRRAGFEANPMILSTRSHGFASSLYPILKQFNHVVAHVMLDTIPVLVDLGNRHRPFHLVRGESLNEEGFLVHEKTPTWLRLATPTDAESTLVTLEIGEDGTLKGTVDKTLSGYAAANLRSDFADDASMKFLQAELAKRYPDIQLDSTRIEPHSSQKDVVVEHFKFTIPNGAQVAGDMIYLNPPLLTIFSENPFKSEKRLYPVEFLNPRRFNSTLNLKVPEGFIVSEMPEATNLNLPNDGARFRMVVGNREGMVQVSLRVNLNQLYFEPEEYIGLRHFYDLVIEKQSEQIVFKRQ